MTLFKLYFQKLFILLFILAPVLTKAQFGNLIKKLDSNLNVEKNKITNNGSSQSSNPVSTLGQAPSSLDIASGLKEALQKGVKHGVDQVSAENGFFKNPSIKVLFPPDAKRIEATLRDIGLNKICDDAILSMNRAAEDASKHAATIFLNAILQMSFQDGMAILKGSDNAATVYFQNTTTEALKKAFRPSIDSSLKKVHADTYWKTVIVAYNKVPFVTKVNPDLGDYVTGAGISGLFFVIAQEELKIRKDLSARTSPLLQKVFGYVDGQR